jgi:hypothetical protein
LGQGEEERGLVSGAEGGKEATDSGMGFPSRGQLGSAQDDSRRVYQAQIDGTVISLVESCKEFHGFFLLLDDLQGRPWIKDSLSFLFSGIVTRVSSFHR